MSETKVIDKVKQEGKREARKAAFSPLTELLTRIGFGARGLIYLVMGVIAIQVVQGSRNAPADQQGAIAAIGAHPIGHILLLIVMIGLVGYSLWGVVRAVFDPLHLGSDPKGFLQRFWFFISAAAYGSLVLPTYNYLTGSANAAHNNAQTTQTRLFASRLMTMPWGRWIVGIVGIIVVGVGLAQIYQAFRRQFDKQFKLYDLDPQQAIWIKRIGRFGTAARGIVFALTGIFLALAAYQFNPQKAQGIVGALLSLLRQPLGPWLLAVVALGLIAFGIYSISGAALFRLKR